MCTMEHLLQVLYDSIEDLGGDVMTPVRPLVPELWRRDPLFEDGLGRNQSAPPCRNQGGLDLCDVLPS